MTSHTTKSFRKLFRELPLEVQRAARKNYKLWREYEHHPSLEFKRVHPVRSVFSVRIGLGWRAVGVRKGDAMLWYWIGSHNHYDKLLREL